MKHVVYYFGGTGNTLTVAKALEGQGASVISIASEMHEIQNDNAATVKCDADKVGFCFPLYYLGLPKIVHEFLEKLELTNATYVYMVCSMGWNLRGGAIKQVKQHLSKKNITLNMGSYIHMPMNDFTFVSVCEPDKQKVILAGFQKNMDKILERIEKSRKYFDWEPIKFLVEKRNLPFCEKVSGDDQKFSVTEECIGCGICTKVCSCKNVELVDGKPMWKHNCQSCLACFHYCPKHAIMYDGKGEEIPHYHHPNVSAAEIQKNYCGK